MWFIIGETKISQRIINDESYTPMVFYNQDNSNYYGILYNYDTSKNGVSLLYNNTLISDTEMREPAYLSDDSVADASEHNTIGITQSLLTKEFNSMIKSVIKYGGFYVGRYESSIDNNVVESVANSIPMNNITWYKMYQYQNSNYSYNPYYNSNIISSSMIWGSQYDAMMNWLEKKGLEIEKSDTNEIKNLTVITRWKKNRYFK